MTALEKKAKAHADRVLDGVGSLVKLLDAHELVMQAYQAGWNDRELKDEKPVDNEEAEKILAYLSNRVQREFRASPANLRVIKARLREKDVTAKEIMVMIDRMAQKWMGTDMEEYLRPSTLFRPSKFDSYYTARHLPVEGQRRERQQVVY